MEDSHAKLSTKYEELISKPLTSTPTCYSFADHDTTKKLIFNTKFTTNGNC